MMPDKKKAQPLATSDVERLLADPSPAVRAETAAKVANQFTGGSLSESERAAAEDIFRVMIRDVEVRVRESLARAVKESTSLSHDIAISLAKDVDQVALPMLAYSSVLTDEDLIEIVHEAGPKKQQAIATRLEVSAGVSEALVDRGDEDAVHLLVSNHGADIPENSLEKVLDQFGDHDRLHGPLAARPKLPLRVAERMVSMVSDSLQEYILTKHSLRPGLVSDLVMASRERATVSFLDGRASDEAVLDLVRQLAANDRLTASIILRALCLGDLRFCETSLAVLAGVPTMSAQTLIHDSGSLGLKGIYDKASLPPELFKAFKVAIKVVREIDYDERENDRERFRRRAIERILTQYSDVESDDLDYLLAKLSEFSGTIPSHA
ncbi:MAG: DUF2336 domain-containing protein [Alphaproteobacteria bacterium]|nr:DUF2336 domain-containing protein [Alphaproteobacteria bacterium]